MSHKTYKTEIKPTQQQVDKILQTIGVCRFVYNLFIAVNKERYAKGETYLNGYAFSKWLNNDYRYLHPENSWIQDVSSKSVKDSVMNAHYAYQQFLSGERGFPRFKKKHLSKTGVYFPRNNPKDIEVERHRIKIPTLGFVRLKEFGYIPVGTTVTGVTIKTIAKRFYVSCTVDIPVTPTQSTGDNLGIDLGVKEFAVISTGEVFNNINKSKRVRRLNKRLKREQRRFSRKIIHRKKVTTATESTNCDKQRTKVQKIFHKLECIRKDYIKKIVSSLVKTKPASITIEDLNIQGMMKNRHLSKAIAQQNFYYFRSKLTEKCLQLGIKLRIADRFYPSSKTCSKCGATKKDLNLSDRTYICPACGLEIDRDLNAAINLKHCAHYKVA
ncbi:transposase [Synergistales bacterium]|nr:transposase [Synergistales bacterium]